MHILTQQAWDPRRHSCRWSWGEEKEGRRKGEGEEAGEGKADMALSGREAQKVLLCGGDWHRLGHRGPRPESQFLHLWLGLRPQFAPLENKANVRSCCVGRDEEAEDLEPCGSSGHVDFVI